MAAQPAESTLEAEDAVAGSPPVLDIVGCGAAMRTLHLLGLRELVRKGLVTVAGCFDLDLDNARAVAEMLDAREIRDTPTNVGGRTDVQGAVIATPPQSHAALAEDYVSAGKHVLVEKPFVVSTSAAEAVLGAAQAAGSRILVNHYWRFYPSIEIARGLLGENAIGEVRQVHAVHGGRWDWPAASDYATTNPYGGVLWDTGSHVLDAVLHALSLDGPAQDVTTKVISSSRTPSREPSQEIVAAARVDTGSSEIDLHLALSRTRSLACAIKFFGDRGTLVVPTLFSYAAIMRVGTGEFVEVRSQTTARTPKSLRGLFRLVHEEFLMTLREDRRSSRLTGDSFLMLTRLLESLTDTGE